MRILLALAVAISLTMFAGLGGCSSKTENREQAEMKAKDRKAHEEARKAGKSFGVEENK